MDAKKAGGEDDLSMEEILQSIRKIIAEEDDGAPEKAADAAPTEQNGSDVLELTEMIDDDGNVTTVSEQPEPEANTAPAAQTETDATPAQEEAATTPVTDVLSQLDEALEVPDVSPAEPEKPAEKPTEKPAEAPVAPQPAMPAAPQKAPDAANTSQDSVDSLLSTQAASAVADAFKKASAPQEKPAQAASNVPSQFASGATLEAMVAEMMRPMLKEWLDANLPDMVERIVEAEVKKLSR